MTDHMGMQEQVSNLSKDIANLENELGRKQEVVETLTANLDTYTATITKIRDRIDDVTDKIYADLSKKVCCEHDLYASHAQLHPTSVQNGNWHSFP